MPEDVAFRAANFAPDLLFPERTEPIEALAEPRMALVKPPGDGPFPAVVMLHQCAGINPAVTTWAREAVTRGYAVMLVDSLKPRGVRSVCYGPRAGVNLFRGARDAFQAAAHLRTLPFVDGKRVSLIGFSWGGMVGLIAASDRYVRALGGQRFYTVASLYPGCFRVARPNTPAFDIVSDDMKQPVLVLMGETDIETPAAECIQKLQAAKESGALVDWHVYQQTGHCWDCQQLDGLSKTDVRGNLISYHYRSDVTSDSMDRLYKFIANH
jgi:dienelactone hydrolase